MPLFYLDPALDASYLPAVCFPCRFFEIILSSSTIPEEGFKGRLKLWKNFPKIKGRSKDSLNFLIFLSLNYQTLPIGAFGTQTGNL